MAIGCAYETCGEPMNDDLLDYCFAIAIGLMLAFGFVWELSK